MDDRFHGELRWCPDTRVLLSVGRIRELPHIVFLPSLKLHESKLVLKLYKLRLLTSLLTARDTNVALDSRVSLSSVKTLVKTKADHSR